MQLKIIRGFGLSFLCLLLFCCCSPTVHLGDTKKINIKGIEYAINNIVLKMYQNPKNEIIYLNTHLEFRDSKDFPFLKMDSNVLKDYYYNEKKNFPSKIKIPNRNKKQFKKSNTLSIFSANSTLTYCYLSPVIVMDNKTDYLIQIVMLFNDGNDRISLEGYYILKLDNNYLFKSHTEHHLSMELIENINE